MDHNLDETLNLESAIGMDFGHAEDVVVSQTDISLDTGSHEADIGMEFDHIEEQPILMDTGNEEIIDFMGDQFNLQEYSVQDDQTSVLTTTEESNQQILASQGDSMIDLNFEPQINPNIKQDVKEKPKYITVKAAPSTRPTTTRKNDSAVLTALPKQVAIAPKPPKLVPVAQKMSFYGGKQYAIAPKPVTLVVNRSIVKKIPLSSIQGTSKGNTVLAQIGKQLVVMPSGSSHKIKLVETSAAGGSSVQYVKSNIEQGQIVTKNMTNLHTGKPIVAKVVMQGAAGAAGGASGEASNQSAMLTKLVPAGAAPARYVMQQKTVPIPTNKVLLPSPTKQGVMFGKKQQIITLKSPTPKLMPAPAQGQTKKVVITANPSQNVILKTTAPPKTAQITKDGKVVLQGQRSELHQISVPGEGIKYIRLITNQTPATLKTATKPQSTLQSVPKYVFTEKVGPQKLVRIAPLTAKPTPVSAPSRSSQSLLAPLSPAEVAIKLERHEEQTADILDSFDSSVIEATTEELPMDDAEESDLYPEAGLDVKAGILTCDGGGELQGEDCDGQGEGEGEEEGEGDTETDSKVALRALIADAVRDQAADAAQYHAAQGAEDSESAEDSLERLAPRGRAEDHPLIVISSNYMTRDAERDPDDHDDSSRINSLLNIEPDVGNSYQSQMSPTAIADCDAISGELGFKPRRACNCTKSQCLKLYCDCFANGEFCFRCNCNNCHNNLDNEELRQKAIRACLERNPNAFRPKIGKTKSGGPEIIRRHNKGCNCKRSGCLKNYCECYEAKIACTSMCKCVGCRNVEETLHRARRPPAPGALFRAPALAQLNFMTTEVIEAVCQCLLAAAADNERPPDVQPDPVRDVIDEFSRCLQDIIGASHHSAPQHLLDEEQA